MRVTLFCEFVPFTYSSDRPGGIWEIARVVIVGCVSAMTNNARALS